MVAHCAAGLAVSTTCRGVGIKNLRWQDVDLFNRIATIRRSKTVAGLRTIPVNGDAMAAVARLQQPRARALRFPRLRGADYRSLAPAEELAHGVAKAGARNRQVRRQKSRATGPRIRQRSSRRHCLLETCRRTDLQSTLSRPMPPSYHRNGGSWRVRRHADGSRRSHVAPDARTLQPRAHGREALGAGKIGKRSDGRAAGNDSAGTKESELRPYVTIRSQLLPPTFPLFVSA